VDIETSATENEYETTISNKKRKMSSSSDDSYEGIIFIIRNI